MKKTITFLLILTLALSVLTASQSTQDKSWLKTTLEDASSIRNLYGRATMVRENSFSFGGGLNIGIETNAFQFSLYGLGDYFPKPIGGTGGAASLEFMAETGAMFAWKIIEAWITKNYIAIDFGYYMQFAKIPQDPDTLFLAKNGFMIRPKIHTLLQISKHHSISISLYYQIPLYPHYSDYKGLGISLGIAR